MGREVMAAEQEIRLCGINPHAHPCLRPALVATIRAGQFNGHRGLHFVQMWGGVTVRVASNVIGRHQAVQDPILLPLPQILRRQVLNNTAMMRFMPLLRDIKQVVVTERRPVPEDRKLMARVV
jgi:hypothetical protein